MREKKSEIDIVFMDIQMPIMRGDEAARLFRAWEAEHNQDALPPLKIFACTGNVTSTDVEAHLRCGFDGCVSKPVHPSTLETILNGTEAEVRKVLLPSSSSVCYHTHDSIC